MFAYELAAAYELCYAGAACLQLWVTCRDRNHAGRLWEDGLWVRAALRVLLTRIADVLRSPQPVAAPGDDRIDSRLSFLVAEAAQSGAPVTPFGASMPHSPKRPGDSGGR
jgi:hypothetical protein